MVLHSRGLHHFHRRKRIWQKHEKYPHPEKWKRLMDRIIYVIAVLGPVMTLPQVFRIWTEQNAAGVSALSWSSYLVFSFFWLAYGIMHREKVIILANVIWIVLDVLIVAGTLVYGSP